MAKARRSASQSRWMTERNNDDFFRRAKSDGYRSRSVYKLKEIDQSDQILKRGMTVVDLGAAPGGWSQYTKARVGSEGELVAVDLLPMEAIEGVHFLQGDFSSGELKQQLAAHLAGKRIDLVICDIAPNTSGIVSVDQARSIGLAEEVLSFSKYYLSVGGSLLIKLFEGEGINEFRSQFKAVFSATVSRKPKASRSRSRELYLLGRGRRKYETPLDA